MGWVTPVLTLNNKQSILGAFYFILGNIRPCYRSCTTMIHLIALSKVAVLKKFGINKIFKPFMEDIKQLEAVSYVEIDEAY